MSEWFIDCQSLIPQGQLAQFLTIGRVDHVSGRCEIMEATMRETDPTGAFPLPDGNSPLVAFGTGVVDDRCLNALLQAIMDFAWKRGLRPSKFDPSAGELAAVQAHLADMRRIALDAGKTVPDVTGDIGAGEGAKW